MAEEKITKKDVQKIVDKAIDRFARLINVNFSGQDNKITKLDAKIDGVEARLDAKIDGVEARLDAKIDGVEARLATKMAEGNDMIIRELKAMREENAAAVGGKQRIDDKLLNHEDRIVSLENFTKTKKMKIAAKCRTKN
ncbi:hypothetical protein A2303_06250 [Candidatus Falkowbacteria bacterium RIFOXYB2_FULL_47_14]|uniref:Uncharacterized protein n=1 Tax=Candidatus Falkowbacteria bacterium RIFOXYA2_FULL_47_19 TaxID=1797994 RepID=A0A1F5SNE0_9BACT|nr:MAG: hypothetical protein A2227_05145 [Candidatus Falkowbacteria bacterium RIFOXYA2_FULL_47_19]OGF35120.1 MAG: hypothetical protein A2468_04000 [Candidatus Falkowbacteria bacterium RIFOXYC2_FULL_46_15]OGF43162.1 MAG: hypothetical protein A2303_06250 [Candidatus Falkowbacteria bacterium RIFOXYB2_FULL_47_14]